jgi:membrane associated rhomboid family serine protease
MKRYSSVSIALIVVSAAVALFSNLGSSHDALRILFISNPGSEGLQDILGGQLWRLITPIFIHFGLMHFVFNMMWIWDLGNLIEARKGARFYIGFVLAVGALSNLAQYLFAQSPFFGGMSGVVYGLFGYIWIRGRADPGFAAGVHKSTAIMMLGWFVLCWTGLLGPIANWAHTAGLVLGAAWGFAGRRSLDTQGTSPTDDTTAQQRLEYLSTTDMLMLEAQRQWVRGHYLPEAQHKYDSVAGKLAIIDAILSQKSANPPKGEELQSLEIAFGDALVQETGAQWGALDDGKKRTPVLAVAETPMIVFPLVTISMLIQRSEPFDLHQVFRGAVQSIQQQVTAKAQA